MPASRLPIDNPTTFTPLPYGLLQVVQPITPASTHWQNGVIWDSICGRGGDTTYNECVPVTGAPAPEPPTKAATDEFETRGATPFTVYARFDCSPVGLVEARQKAEQALARSAPFQVESAFWTGLAAGQTVVYPHLASAAEVIDPETGALMQTAAEVGLASDVSCALGYLEDVLSDCYGGVGVIHVPRQAVPALKAWNLIEARGPQLRTTNGHLVAVGSGYPGTGPSGEAVDQCRSWMFATGAVFAYTSDVKIRGEGSELDRSTNTRELIAERTYLLGWDCCHAAVETDLSVPVGPGVA